MIYFKKKMYKPKTIFLSSPNFVGICVRQCCHHVVTFELVIVVEVLTTEERFQAPKKRWKSLRAAQKVVKL